jgi:hypothetical protein
MLIVSPLTRANIMCFELLDFTCKVGRLTPSGSYRTDIVQCMSGTVYTFRLKSCSISLLGRDIVSLKEKFTCVDGHEKDVDLGHTTYSGVGGTLTRHIQPSQP